MGTGFNEKSYALHRKSYSGARKELQESWFREDTADAWRVKRMYAPFETYVRSCGDSSWLTIGDGRFGLDAIHLQKMNPGIRVLPTDISTTLLEEAKQKGLISGFKEENAERLSFPDRSFDHVLCKESYHHFPRPGMALYEMLRVAKKSVLLLEPNDHLPDSLPGKFTWKLKAMIKRLFGKKREHHDHYRFEEIGNYVYALSKRDLEKTALGMSLPVIAIHYLNDHYEPGAEFEPADDSSPAFRKIKKEIRRLDRRSAWGLENHRLIAAVIFLEQPGPEQLSALEKSGFEIINLPSNPHLRSL